MEGIYHREILRFVVMKTKAKISLPAFGFVSDGKQIYLAEAS